MNPSKSVALGAHRFTVFGPSEDDHYFRHVGDGMDPEHTRFVERNVAPDAVCVDIGANIGLKALQLSRLAPQGRVLAVEAGPRIHECLRMAAEANGAANLVTEHAAVTASDGGTLCFEENSAYGHIAPDGAADTVAVPATSLDALVRRHALPRLDFLKLDVEGFEFPILRASRDLLARHGTVACLEFNSWCILAFTDDQPRLCLEWLLASFAEVWRLRRDNPPELQLERVLPGTAARVLAENLMQDGLVTDIVVCDRPGRVRP